MTDTAIDPDRQVDALVAESPRFARVFEAVGIDYYCTDNFTLEEACVRQDLDVTAVCEMLADVERGNEEQSNDWQSLTALIDDIGSTHHRYFRDKVPTIESLVRESSQTHGNEHPELEELVRELSELATDVRTHISMTENEVFPLLEKLDENRPIEGSELRSLREALNDIRTHNENIADRLERISTLRDEISVMNDSRDWFQEIDARLETLERNVHSHIHRENNILLPRSERQLDREEYELLVPYPTAYYSHLKSLDSAIETPYQPDSN